LLQHEQSFAKQIVKQIVICALLDCSAYDQDITNDVQ